MCIRDSLNAVSCKLIDNFVLNSENVLEIYEKITIPASGENYYINGGTISFDRLKNYIHDIQQPLRSYSETGKFLGLAKCTADGVKCIWKKNKEDKI